MKDTLPAREIKALFNAIDINNDQSLEYNELLNYIFAAKREDEKIKTLKKIQERAKDMRLKYEGENDN